MGNSMNEHEPITLGDIPVRLTIDTSDLREYSDVLKTVGGFEAEPVTEAEELLREMARDPGQEAVTFFTQDNYTWRVRSTYSLDVPHQLRIEGSYGD